MTRQKNLAKAFAGTIAGVLVLAVLAEVGGEGGPTLEG